MLRFRPRKHRVVGPLPNGQKISHGFSIKGGDPSSTEPSPGMILQVHPLKNPRKLTLKNVENRPLEKDDISMDDNHFHGRSNWDRNFPCIIMIIIMIIHFVGKHWLWMILRVDRIELLGVHVPMLRCRRTILGTRGFAFRSPVDLQKHWGEFGCYLPWW